MEQTASTLYSAADMRALDRLAAFALVGAGGDELMRRAGRAAYRRLRERWPRARRVCVFCGAGNNAGDGYVIARLARADGLEVDIYCLAEPAGLKGEAASAFQSARVAGVQPRRWTAASEDAAGRAEVIVDALLGTGLARGCQGDWHAAIERINAAPAPVLAVDIPSGIHADTGRRLNAAVRAALTVSFIGLKKGLFTADAPDHCGEIVLEDLDTPAEVYAQVDAQTQAPCRLLRGEYVPAFAPRPRTAHKGHNGHVLIIGGNQGMAGAVILAGRAALFAGAGLVSVATRPRHVAAVVGSQPELMAHGVRHGAELDPLLRRASVVAIGPGLGQDAWANEMLAKTFEKRPPAVLDADALNLLARQPVAYQNAVLTPHPTEAARLLGVSTQAVMDDRFTAAQQLHEKYAGVVVLKGAGTLITPPLRLCADGNPGMAVAGMGDILSGVIAALMAQGLAPAHAAQLGVWAHANAADTQAREYGERGMLAGDILPRLRPLLNA